MISKIPQIIIIEDEPQIHDIIRIVLPKWLNVTSVYNIEEAKSKFSTDSFDLAIVDLHLKNEDGIDLIKTIKNKYDKNLMFIVITGSDSQKKELQSHDLGIMDYIKKPFDPLVLSKIVEKNISRIFNNSSSQVERGIICIDLDKFQVKVENQLTHLTKKEYLILLKLIKNEGKTIPKELLIESIWEHECDIPERSIDTHICSLRKKLGKAGSYIKTIRGIGLIFEI